MDLVQLIITLSSIRRYNLVKNIGNNFKVSYLYSMGIKLKDLALEAKANLPGPTNYDIKPIGWSPGYKLSGMASRA